MSVIEIEVPDIGDFSEVEVIEVLVKPGDDISIEQSLITVESDKASMEIPSPAAGKLRELKVKVGDKVAKGALVGTLESSEAEEAPAARSSKADGAAVPADDSAAADDEVPAEDVAAADDEAPADDAGSGSTGTASTAQDTGDAEGKSGSTGGGESGAAGTSEVKVPDIGDFDEVEVIEVLVAAGDVVSLEQSLITVESDKASMEIPSSAAGKVAQVLVKVGDKVSKGTPVALVEAAADAAAPKPGAGDSKPAAQSAPAAGAQAGAREDGAREDGAREDGARDDGARDDGAREDKEKTKPAAGASEAASGAASEAGSGAASEAASGPSSSTRAHPVPAEMRDGKVAMKPHASPSVRLFARELGVDLSRVKGSGPKNRITADDVRSFVKGVVAGADSAKPAQSGDAPAGGAGLGLIPWPKVDFAKYGEIEVKPMARIRKIASANLHRNWVMIPHVTNHDDADITDLEAFRLKLNAENAKGGTKLTMLAFLVKASVAALKKFPEFNSSLEGDSLVYKKYFHIGFAADTPNGLVVPVIRDADRKGLFDIAAEMAQLALKARDGKLGPGDMQGGTFSISSLGGIGGTYFTPIINAPEVAILGVCRSSMRPVWDAATGAFQPRLILPLSLSWDHRVIDGAAAARFNSYLAQLLGDFRRIVL